MKKAKRKYLSEYAVNMFSAGFVVVHANQVGIEGHSNTDELAKKCHIYAICRRPRFSIDPDTFSYSDGQVCCDLLYKINGVLKRIGIKYNLPLLDDAVDVIASPYPHREIHTINEKDEVVRYVPAYMISFTRDAIKNDKTINYLEVQYVGQAYGDGSRTFIDRIKNHSTLQKILANVQYDLPDDEIFILGFEYRDYRLVALFDGISKNTIDDERDRQRFHSILENPLKKNQQICLIEAALIRYFQPKYNEIYKVNFPSNKHKILKSCYELDFSGLAVEVNTEDLEFYLYSETKEPLLHHICRIELFSAKDRLGFFSFQDKKGNIHSSSDDIINPTN